MNSRKRRAIALLVCLVLCFVVLGSSVFIAEQAEHDCTGQECEICAQIAFAVGVLRSTVILGAVTAFSLCTAGLRRQTIINTADRMPAIQTLVGWKVRLDN